MLGNMLNEILCEKVYDLQAFPYQTFFQLYATRKKLNECILANSMSKTQLFSWWPFKMKVKRSHVTVYSPFFSPFKIRFCVWKTTYLCKWMCITDPSIERTVLLIVPSNSRCCEAKKLYQGGFHDNLNTVFCGAGLMGRDNNLDLYPQN